MAPFRAALDAYHSQTQPSEWLEALTKAYVGDSIANDFAREVARGLSPADRDLVLEVLRESRYADFAAAEIRQALIGDESQTNRLSMWARRLVGEALARRSGSRPSDPPSPTCSPLCRMPAATCRHAPAPDHRSHRTDGRHRPQQLSFFRQADA